MALRNTATAAAAPAFEPAPDETATVSAPPVANDTPAVAPVKAPSALTLTGKEASAFAKEVEAMKGAADFTWGNYQVFKGNNGEIVSTGEKQVSMGRWAKISMIAWDDHFEVSPNSKSEKSKDYVAYSKDGDTVDRVIGENLQTWSGRPVTEYIDFLRSEDYPEANSRRFIDVGCVVHDAEAEDGKALAGEVIQVTLSQSSIPSFSRYQERLLQKARAIARNIPGVKVPEDPFTFYFLRQLAASNGNNWTKLEVLDKLPAKI